MVKKSGTFILLKKVRFAESDLILTGISSEGEKKSFLARSALKSRKRFGGGVLEPTHFVEIGYSEKPGENRLGTLDEASLIAARQLFPATPDVRLFHHIKIEMQSRLCWEWGIERGQRMLLEQLPYAISWF